ncbi:hypothetical protein TNCV_2480751 [Trichonephila clavipes]|nr:hypothetical protein TNCV_2480751 [Trichonephila clavipes]
MPAVYVPVSGAFHYNTNPLRWFRLGLESCGGSNQVWTAKPAEVHQTVIITIFGWSWDFGKCCVVFGHPTTVLTIAGCCTEFTFRQIS